jgi:photosystem II stability/assembly factor-like uncharacterized protein
MRVASVVLCVALVMLLAVPAFGQWQFAYQMDLDISFYGVDFPTSTVGYVVGGGGEIYKTTDGGNTWVQQTSPGTLTLFDVFFKDANNGWAVGDGGVIVQTTDGTNWVEHDSSGVLSGSDLNAIQFIGSTGWIGGDGGVVFLTSDDGVSWDPPTTNPYTDDCNDLSFVSSSIGYAAMDGDGIMYTEDGGDVWNASSVNLGVYPYTRTDIEVIMSVNDTIGIASGWGSLIGPQPTIILVTQDAGKTWNSPDPMAYHWNTYGYGYALAKWADDEILLSGGGAGSAAFVLHSTDYGANWTDTPAFSGEDSRAACTVPGTDRVVMVGDEGKLALSTDKGVTWSWAFAPGPGFAGWYGVANATSEEVLIVGANGHLLKLPGDKVGQPTGGWEFGAVSPENFAPSRLEDIVFIDGVYYVSGGNRYLCKSTDMGNTWTQLEHANSATDAIYKMWWFDANNGVLVGEIGSRETIWRTVDGGQTLNIVWNDSTGASLQFNSVSFAPENPLIGSVVGDNVATAYTTDGGVTWSWANSGLTSTADLEEVHLVSATDGWSVGDGGLVLRTSDGGQNWAVQTNPSTTIGLRDVHFRGPDHPGYGWIAGDDGTFFYTDDGGANWTAADPTLDPTSKDINVVYYQSAGGNLWIGVDDGDALYRHNDAVTAADNPASPEYTLGQNYPNPFNPQTSIEISLPEEDHVTLEIFDVSGRLVSTVLNRTMEAGDHTVRFDARGLASGVYFYRLTTKAGVQTRKMVLLR